MFNTTVFFVLLLSCCLSLANASQVPLERIMSGVITQCTVNNTAALTFDDGPYIYMTHLVKTLKAANAKGTFFFNGLNWRCIYDMEGAVKLAYDSGFQVASHTWSHANLSKLSRDETNREFERVEEAIWKITGAKVAYTRPPYGAYNDVTIEVANARKQKLVNWDFDSGDSQGVSPGDQKARYDEVAKKRPSTILSLQHEVHEPSVYDVLPHAVKVLQKAGYKLVTVAECLGQQPYHSVGHPSPRDPTWHC